MIRLGQNQWAWRSKEDAWAAVELAAELLSKAQSMQTSAERRQQAELDRLVAHDRDKATLVEMTDQAFRTHTPARVADQLAHVLGVQGVPQFFNPVERAMLRGFQAFGQYLPGVAVPLVKEKMRQETANVILPAESHLLTDHLRARQSHGVAMNVNLLGEALLGEQETRRRLNKYLDLLRMPDVRCLSVKLTTLYSQVSPLAWQHTVKTVADRLELLYRNANRNVDATTGRGKFIYLDMEEYRDLHLTADVLRMALSREGLQQSRAGIALQAYVPDSRSVMRSLIGWSRHRVADGGTPLTIRLVKGANMEMERVVASIEGVEAAPYDRKSDTDANFKAMLAELIDAASKGDICVGIASHNLFDVALAMIWTEASGCGDAVQFEMLEGMANHQRRAISQTDRPLLLYAPACTQHDFIHAIGYLIRRLDENTGHENFLRHSYRLHADSPEFQRLAEAFVDSVNEMDTVSIESHRTQDRRQPVVMPSTADDWTHFVNEPDTDWSRPHNAAWIESVLETWRQRSEQASERIQPVTSANEVTSDGEIVSRDVSQPHRVTLRCELADSETVQRAVNAATQSDWKSTDVAHRHRLLRNVAQTLRQRRGELIASMVADAGKSVAQADPEVSEAVDFCEFYPLTMRMWDRDVSVKVTPRGAMAVITPWNFPLAIAAGGIASGLAAGNPVLLKPSLETLLPAWRLCQAFWDSGVPTHALQFVPCTDSVAQSSLVENLDIEAVILTGGTDTAKAMLAARPGLHLLAETGGKNATIVTAMADRDLAIKHVVASAFGHAGQKCSATSLMLLQAEVFDDETFRETLADAVRSLVVGSAWDLHTSITPLVCQPNASLTRGLKELEPGESWLVMPEHVVNHADDVEGTLYRPGVKWNVSADSFTSMTELFGPVLGVMRYQRLEEAIEIVRRTGYGLTSGIETLDDREVELWKRTVSAGNLYINRPTTGAIVLRQPFGGVGWSAYGPGVKAGGPHYVLALSEVEDRHETLLEHSHPTSQSELEGTALGGFVHWLDALPSADRVDPQAQRRLRAAIASQLAALKNEFSLEHDTFQLVGQDNHRRYRPVEGMDVRVTAGDHLDDVLVALSASMAVKTPITLSMEPALSAQTRELFESLADAIPSMIDPVVQTDGDLMASLTEMPIARLRCFAPLPKPVAEVCGRQFISVVAEPVVTQGRIECLRYLNEQSVSHDYHRYGNLGRRGIDSALSIHQSLAKR
ncbi:MAG: bifunctional proline dehydrogenase/L-glutamate gamma-semialdehyde dehydrogenase [Planctomycetota bacterium]